MDLLRGCKATHAAVSCCCGNGSSVRHARSIGTHISGQDLHARHRVHWVPSRGCWACLACGGIARAKALKLALRCVPSTQGEKLCRQLEIEAWTTTATPPGWWGLG